MLDFQRQSTTELTEAIKDQLAAAEKSIQSEYQQAEAARKTAAENLNKAITTREATKATLEAIKIAQAGSFEIPGITDGLAGASLAKRWFNVAAEIEQQQRNIDNLRTVVRIRDSVLAKLDVAAGNDPTKARDRQLEKDVARLTAFRNAGTGIFKDAKDEQALYRAELDKLTDARNRDVKAIEAQAKAQRAAAKDLRETAAFILPIVGGRITSGFGPRTRPTSGASANHPAIDIATPIGTPVRAPQVGTVKAIGFDKGLGKYIVLDHGAGTTSRFGHLSDNSIVREGELVQQGALIGKTGNTGISTGPHLDYQVKVNGKPIDPRSSPFPFDPTKVAEAAEQAGKVLQNFGESAAERVARITAEFDRQPRAIDRTAATTRELEKIYSDLDKRGLLDADATKGIRDAFAAITDFSTRPFQEMLQAGREQLEVQRLIVDGRSLDAEVLERGIALQKTQASVTAEQLAAIRSQVVEQRALTAEIERQNAFRQIEAGLIDSTRGNLRQGFSEVARGGGIGAVGDIFKRQFGIMRESALDHLFEQAFGGLFTNAKDKALGFDKVKEASRDQAKVAEDLTATLRRLDAAAAGAAGTLAGSDVGGGDTLERDFDSAFANRLGVASISEMLRKGAPIDPWRTILHGAGAANDNVGSDLITARGGPPRQFATDLITKFADVFVDPRTARKIGEGISDGIGGRGNGAAYGMLTSGLILGKGGSQLGSSIGGSLGEKFGEKVLGKALGKLGDFAGPLGSIAGGLIGGVLGGALTSTPRASATIGGGAAGGGFDVTTRGNSKSLRDAASKSAGEALDTLDKIAEALGATVNEANGRVSIGYRKGNARVDTTGSGITKTSRGAVDFGQDTAAAIKYATLDLIKDGVLAGLKESTQRILQQGTDLDRAIQKATDFESVFTRLKEHRDPVGASLDVLDKEFGRLGTIFKEAGASAAEYADLEALYGLERAKAIKDAQQRAFGSLQGLVDGLMIGDNGLSLRSRLASAQAAYDPLKARVQAGDVTANDDFASSAQTLLDVARQLYGSQRGYFDLFDEVRNVATGALDRSQAIADAAINRDSPFSGSAVPARDDASVVSAIEQQTNTLAAGQADQIRMLTAMNQNLQIAVQQLIAANNNSGSTPYPEFKSYA